LSHQEDVVRPSTAFVGTPAQVIEQMQQFVDLGVNYFMLRSGGFPDVTTLELLVSGVIPVLNR
jgi:alkanesulfonate monooxygenase SsuD/methylene tetrahydromethanopterin reductase-like flavin-dependent oxidoreductase (luciferase family)